MKRESSERAPPFCAALFFADDGGFASKTKTGLRHVGQGELEGFGGRIDMLKSPGAVATFRDGGEDEERRVAWRCGGGLGRVGMVGCWGRRRLCGMGDW